jgi:hypothetical protein
MTCDLSRNCQWIDGRTADSGFQVIYQMFSLYHIETVRRVTSYYDAIKPRKARHITAFLCWLKRTFNFYGVA